MAARFPQDRFDTADDRLERVGAHRAPRRGGHGWIGVAWAALACGLLVGAGFIVLKQLDAGTLVHDPVSTATASSTPTPTVEPTVNPNAIVTILNGTKVPGLAGHAAAALTKAGWKTPAAADASSTDFQQTVVCYQDPAMKADALGVAKSLPGATIDFTQQFAQTGSDITVVLGTDYAKAVGEG